MKLIELQACCEECGLNLDRMRFALGLDKGHEPKWFYIYLDDMSGEWVVAKNKSDGTRFERYRGYDEDEAVQIISDKMEEEAAKRGYSLRGGIISEQRVYPTEEPVYEPQPKSHKWLYVNLIIATILVVVFVSWYSWASYARRSGGPWREGGGGFSGVWEQIDLPIVSTWDYYDSGYDSGYEDYDYSYDYEEDWGDDWDSDDTDWDSDWDSGWDSGDTDWDSDW